MANTYEIIKTYTLNSGSSATIVFTNIPQTFTDLTMYISARNATNNYGGYQIRLNGATSSNSYRYVRGTASTPSGGTRTDMIDVATFPISSDTLSTFSNDIVYIPNYASSNYKSFLVESVRDSDTASDWQIRTSGALYSSTNPITSITLTVDTDSFAQYSTATLYGIKNS